MSHEVSEKMSLFSADWNSLCSYTYLHWNIVLEAVNETRLALQHAPVYPYNLFWLFVWLESLSLHLTLYLNVYCCNFIINACFIHDGCGNLTKLSLQIPFKKYFLQTKTLAFLD